MRRCQKCRVLVFVMAAMVWVGGYSSMARAGIDVSSNEFSDVVQEAQRLKELGEEGASDLTQLSGDVYTLYVQGDRVKDATPEQWRWLVEHTRSVLSAEQKAGLREKLRAAYATEQQRQSLAGIQLAELGRALHALGDPDSLKLMVELGKLRGQEVWAHQGSMGIQALSADLARNGTAEQRKALADWLIDERLGDEVSARLLSPGHGVRHWMFLSRQLGGSLDATRRLEWVSRLRAIYINTDSFTERRVGDVAVMVASIEALGQVDTLDITARWLNNQSELSDKDMGNVLKIVAGHRKTAGRSGKVASTNVAALADALRKHGQPVVAGQLSAAWINGQDDLSDLEPAAMLSVVAGLRDAGAPGLRAMRKVPDALADQVLNDPAKIRSLGPDRLGGILRQVKDRCPKSRRTQWANQIWSAYCNGNEVPMQLDRNAMRGLIWTVRNLDAAEGGECAARWFENFDALKQKDPTIAPHYARDAAFYAFVLVSRGKAPEGFDLSEKLDQLEPIWAAAYASGDMTHGRCKQLAFLYSRVWDREKARTWLKRARDLAIAQANESESVRTGQVLGLARLLGNPEFGLVDQDESFPAYVALLIRHVKAGNTLPAESLDRLARPCATDPGRVAILEQISDASGRPTLDLAKILSRAYREDGRLSEWAAHVDGRIEATDGDVAACWLLAKADIRTVAPREINLQWGQAEVGRAMAKATSTEVRLLAVRELVSRYLASGDRGAFKAADQMIKSIEGQFDAEGRTALAKIQSEIAARRSAFDRESARRRLSDAYAHKVAVLRYCQRKLAAAEANGDSALASRLQTKITELSAEISD